MATGVTRQHYSIIHKSLSRSPLLRSVRTSVLAHRNVGALHSTLARKVQPRTANPSGKAPKSEYLAIQTSPAIPAHTSQSPLDFAVHRLSGQ